MRASGCRRGAALLVALVLTTGVSACSPRGTTAAERSTPATDGSPDDQALGAALPGADEVGGIDGFSSCRSTEQVCTSDAGPDPDLSWARAAEGGPGGAGARWADVTVDRQAEPDLVQEVRWLAEVRCPVGEFALPADPRGFRPRPASEGVGRRHPVERAGFTGTRCAMETGPPGGARHEEHWILAARGDVRLYVAASSESLVVQLFEEYLGRLG